MKLILPMAVAAIALTPVAANADMNTTTKTEAQAEVQMDAKANADVAEQIEAIEKTETTVLERLYAEKPDTKREIENAAGYAVFSSGELAVMWVSAGFGHGIAHNNSTGEDTYMKMAKAGVGLGLGAKDADTVFVFSTAEAYNNFIETGLDLTGNADAAAKSGEKGDAASGSASVVPGVNIYQLTDTGLMAQAMIQGTKYWQDDALNAATN